MQVKNTTKNPIKLVVRTNSGETVPVINRETGEEIGKAPAKPQLKTIHIGGLCTVEIEDKDWHQLWDSTGKMAGEVETHEEEHIKLQGTDKDKPLKVTRKEAVTFKKIHTVRRMVKKGVLEIIVAADPKETNEEMLNAVRKELGLPDWKPSDVKALKEMYNKVVG